MPEALTTRPLVLTFVPGGGIILEFSPIPSPKISADFIEYLGWQRSERTDERTNVRTYAVTEKLLKSM